jgi:hypothetical protein
MPHAGDTDARLLGVRGELPEEVGFAGADPGVAQQHRDELLRGQATDGGV